MKQKHNEKVFDFVQRLKSAQSALRRATADEFEAPATQADLNAKHLLLAANVFKEGLIPTIQVRMWAALRDNTLDSAVAAALDAEQRAPAPAPMCAYCRKPGHTESVCHAKARAAGSDLPQIKRERPVTPAPRPANQSVTCFKCGQKGHYADACGNGRPAQASNPFGPSRNPQVKTMRFKRTIGPKNE